MRTGMTILTAVLTAIFFVGGCEKQIAEPTVNKENQQTTEQQADVESGAESLEAMSGASNGLMVEAAGSYTIYRGQKRGFSISPGETITVYYSADGRPATLRYYQPSVWYVWKMPFARIDAYSSSYPSGKWYLMSSSAVDIRVKKMSLLLNRGTYKFVLSCNRESTVIFLQIT